MSSSEHFQRLEQRFHELEQLDTDERTARLAELAQSEPDLYPELLRMLADSTQIGQGERLIDDLIEAAEEISTQALKLTRRGLDSNGVIARFRAERLALAVLAAHYRAHAYGGSTSTSTGWLELIRGFSGPLVTPLPDRIFSSRFQ